LPRSATGSATRNSSPNDRDSILPRCFLLDCLHDSTGDSGTYIFPSHLFTSRFAASPHQDKLERPQPVAILSRFRSATNGVAASSVATVSVATVSVDTSSACSAQGGLDPFVTATTATALPLYRMVTIMQCIHPPLHPLSSLTSLGPSKPLSHLPSTHPLTSPPPPSIQTPPVQALLLPRLAHLLHCLTRRIEAAPVLPVFPMGGNISFFFLTFFEFLSACSLHHVWILEINYAPLCHSNSFLKFLSLNLALCCKLFTPRPATLMSLLYPDISPPLHEPPAILTYLSAI
jgi:hypothetical protein